MLEAMAPDYAGRVRFVVMDATQAPELATSYGVMRVPHVVLFSGGQPIDQIGPGLQPERRYRAMLDKHAPAAV